jgi:hypothetical protein
MRNSFIESEWNEDLDGGTETLKSGKKRRRSTKPPTKKGLSG